jgi:hypothetical protein
MKKGNVRAIRPDCDPAAVACDRAAMLIAAINHDLRRLGALDPENLTLVKGYTTGALAVLDRLGGR